MTWNSSSIVRALYPRASITSLGGGGFGSTYKVSNGTTFVIKLIDPTKTSQDRWNREVTALQSIIHPNVIRYISSAQGKVGKLPYYCLEMEYIDGGTALEAINRKRYTTNNSLKLFLSRALSGLRAAHDAQVFHRDIKPENIGLRGGKWSAPVLLDFGLAKVIADKNYHTSPNTAMGTWRYCPPEQLMGNDPTQRNDIYSMGVVAYESFCGEHPYLAGNPTDDRAEILLILQGAPTPSLPSGMSPGLFAMIRSMLELRNSKRPPLAKLLQSIATQA